MTREEEIINETKKYYSGNIKCYDAFLHGVEFADEHPKNIWHDASEEPSKAYPIMIEINDDIDPTYDVITVDGKDEKFWKFLASDRDITRWAYISDLLPKQFGNSEQLKGGEQ